MRTNDYLIIMAGGIGSRFWPMSRSTFPKQFHDILGTGKTLIQMTFERFQSLIPVENIFVVTHQRYEGLVREQLPALGPKQILKEPAGRNTAPCIAYGCHKIQKRNPNACVFVAASDHLILNEAAFLKDVELGLDACAEQDVIMTLGIPPTRPDTGYGYIQYLEAEGTPSYFKVKTFTEKPSLPIAKKFLESGDFLWNSGMFMFSLKTIFAAFGEFLPDTQDLFLEIADSLDTESEEAAIERVYSRCVKISIDDGIMEKARNVYVIPAAFDWSDLGTWVSLYEEMKKDSEGNAVQGKVRMYDSSNNVIRLDNPDKLLLLDGLHDFIVVDTKDVLLICTKKDEQRIKEFVSEVRKNEGEEYV